MTARPDLAEIERLLANITPGDWHKRNNVGVVFAPDCQVAKCGDFSDKELARFNADRWNADADLIAAAPGHLRALLALVRELEAALEPRPMESAPKDCEIMLFARGRWHIGEWDDDRYAKKARPFWFYSQTWRRTGCRAEPPTAWLPLPPPPKEPV